MRDIMSGFEYKVVPAPVRGLKGKGIKGTQARFANALQTVMNEMGAQGWEYQRTDTLPVEERQGLTGKTTTFQNMLVFRRVLAVDSEEAPVVAALIEDQTDDVVAEAPSAEPEPEPPVVDGAEAVAPESEEDVALDPEARDRISETLEAEPFSFPWNRRERTLESSEKGAPPTSPEDAR
jgi:hypothetical protein